MSVAVSPTGRNSRVVQALLFSTLLVPSLGKAEKVESPFPDTTPPEAYQFEDLVQFALSPNNCIAAKLDASKILNNKGRRTKHFGYSSLRFMHELDLHDNSISRISFFDTLRLHEKTLTGTLSASGRLELRRVRLTNEGITETAFVQHLDDSSGTSEVWFEVRIRGSCQHGGAGVSLKEVYQNDAAGCIKYLLPMLQEFGVPVSALIDPVHVAQVFRN